ncbi:MAG TPA: UTP--glucose-1-phosphate uridylyltransferase [Solirubrobacteraceae bacterium]|nr:UTP--glucose-1-phosphate uridylyltransferase [Solirubrobacteraceae bacterium]
MSAEGLRAAEAKMRAAGQPEEAISAFRHAYQRVERGESAYLRTEDLEPVTDVARFDELTEGEVGDALERVATIKLNGGLATTMGLRQPKSLIEARDGHSFLEIIIGQLVALRRRYGVRLPLALMNSEATRAETLAALERFPELDVGLPLEFMQSMIPKLEAETLEPVSWPKEPALEWCPPGHGDVYGALRRSGLLTRLLEEGFRYAMISNSDNLGARVEPRIPAHMAAEGIPFLMEVVEGTGAERKGGHLARRRADGQIVLRESAQVAPEDEQSFSDYRYWHYYNTNNLWIDLAALDETLEQTGGVLELSLIVNRKTVDPRDPSSTAVLQLEGAMGSAVQSFSGARLLCVPRSRFVPVKTTNDLLVLRSDVYTVGDEMLVEPSPERDGKLPFVDLDKRFYGVLEEFERRFPGGAPSLVAAERLVVRGDVTFGAEVAVRGVVELETEEPLRIEDGSVLGA